MVAILSWTQCVQFHLYAWDLHFLAAQLLEITPPLWLLYVSMTRGWLTDNTDLWYNYSSTAHQGMLKELLIGFWYTWLSATVKMQIY